MSEIPVRDLGTPIAEKSKKVFGSEYSSKHLFPYITYLLNQIYIQNRVLLNRVPSFTHLHAAYFSLYPALCNTLNIIRPKYHMESN